MNNDKLFKLNMTNDVQIHISVRHRCWTKKAGEVYIYVCIYTHTHIHMYIYVYIYFWLKMMSLKTFLKDFVIHTYIYIYLPCSLVHHLCVCGVMWLGKTFHCTPCSLFRWLQYRYIRISDVNVRCDIKIWYHSLYHNLIFINFGFTGQAVETIYT